MLNNLSGVHAYTSFTYSYLPKAMVLAETLKHFNPDWKLTAFISDKKPVELEHLDLSRYFDHVVHLDELDIPPAWIFKHDVVELCTAVKGMVLRMMLEAGAEKVFYLDPDIAVFSELSSLERELDSCNVLLTPHQLAPDSTEHAIIDNEVCSLKHGTFNLGFAGVRNNETGMAFARWWESRLMTFCYDDIPGGLFTDQRWCDLAPCFFDGVKAHKDPGCNVSSWNLSTRAIRESSGGQILVNGSPLKFYHFSKLGELGFTMTTRYAGDSVSVYSLWYWYNNKVDVTTKGLTDGKFDVTKYWYYGKFVDGQTSIPKPARILYRHRVDLQKAFNDPFKEDFLDWSKLNVV
jgi:hypothetical protein